MLQGLSARNISGPVKRFRVSLILERGRAQAQAPERLEQAMLHNQLKSAQQSATSTVKNAKLNATTFVLVRKLADQCDAGRGTTILV
jgi:hypothetical protein